MNTWFAAHIIMWIQNKKNFLQKQYPVYENIYLVSAVDADSAMKKAVEIGRSLEGDCNNTLMWNEEPSTMLFGGIRKLIVCQDYLGILLPQDYDNSKQFHSLELTYSLYILNSQEKLQQLINGDEVSLIYYE